MAERGRGGIARSDRQAVEFVTWDVDGNVGQARNTIYVSSAKDGNVGNVMRRAGWEKSLHPTEGTWEQAGRLGGLWTGKLRSDAQERVNIPAEGAPGCCPRGRKSSEDAPGEVRLGVDDTEEGTPEHADSAEWPLCNKPQTPKRADRFGNTTDFTSSRCSDRAVNATMASAT
jgi:hypothetical protein